MEVRAQLRYLRVSPKKVRLVANLIRGMKTQDAVAQLSLLRKRASMPVLKLVRSAIANATNNFKLSGERMVVKQIFVDQGPTLKRFMPRAHGRATPVRKRTCHVTVVLEDHVDSAGAVVKPAVEGASTEAEDVKLKTKNSKKTARSKKAST